MSQPTTPQAHEMNTPLHGHITILSPTSPTSPETTPSTTFPTALKITPIPTHPTDIWRKPGPPQISTFNAPILYRKLTLKNFIRVRVKLWAQWSGLYDQGGLVMILPPSESAGTGQEGDGEGEEIGKQSQWIKTGVEFYNGEAMVSTVVRDRWADWSLCGDGIRVFEGGMKGTELLIERQEKDDTLWVYVVDVDGGRIPVREVTWVLSEGDEREVWVGVYACTPTPEMGKQGGEEFGVWFEGLEWGVKG